MQLYNSTRMNKSPQLPAAAYSCKSSEVSTQMHEKQFSSFLPCSLSHLALTDKLRQLCFVERPSGLIISEAAAAAAATSAAPAAYRGGAGC